MICEHTYSFALVQHYLNRHAWPGPLISGTPERDLAVIIVIPAFAEMELHLVLEDLHKCTMPVCSVEVIVVVNHSEDADESVRTLHEASVSQWRTWTQQHALRARKYHIIYAADLPRKKAGVGLARKIGMDEAVRRFASLDRPDGLIVCLDADCRVGTDYIIELERFQSANKELECCALYFEHRVDGLDAGHRRAILEYELHLRYMIAIQRWAGYPFAFHTVGSCMAVRAGAYCAVGGMNTRQAGEDFYFLHKIIGRGAFGELNSTCVYPSARPSDRVPFGTGRAVMMQMESDRELTTYHPQSFIDLRAFLSLSPLLWSASSPNLEFLVHHHMPLPVKTFLLENGFFIKMQEIRLNTSSVHAFRKRFFHWFNAFMLIKYLHMTRDRYYPNIPVTIAAGNCIDFLDLPSESKSTEDMLNTLRRLQRNYSIDGRE